MAEHPLISFVIPSYRSESTIARTIHSIYAQQTSKAFEVIRVESGWVALPAPASIQDEVVLWTQEPLGPAAARNWGAGESRGRYLAFVDSDVILLPDWLEQLLATLRREDCPMIGGTISNANPEEVASRVLHLIEFSEFLPGIRAGLKDSISTSNCLLRKDLFNQVGGFREDLQMSEDWDFCRRLPAPPYFSNASGIEHFHRSDWRAVQQHLESLGFWSGKFHREHRTVQGSWLRFLPVLARLLVPLRYYRINLRRKRAELSPEYRFWGDQPGLVRGLCHWAKGFQRGISGRSQSGVKTVR